MFYLFPEEGILKSDEWSYRVPEDKEANSHLEDLKKLGTLEVFRADLAEEGSYDAAVAGCDYAFLLAAPVNYTSKNPEVRGRRRRLSRF